MLPHNAAKCQQLASPPPMLWHTRISQDAPFDHVYVRMPPTRKPRPCRCTGRCLRQGTTHIAEFVLKHCPRLFGPHSSSQKLATHTSYAKPHPQCYAYAPKRRHTLELERMGSQTTPKSQRMPHVRQTLGCAGAHTFKRSGFGITGNNIVAQTKRKHTINKWAEESTHRPMQTRGANEMPMRRAAPPPHCARGPCPRRGPKDRTTKGYALAHTSHQPWLQDRMARRAIRIAATTNRRGPTSIMLRTGGQIPGRVMVSHFGVRKQTLNNSTNSTTCEVRCVCRQRGGPSFDHAWRSGSELRLLPKVETRDLAETRSRRSLPPPPPTGNTSWFMPRLLKTAHTHLPRSCNTHATTLAHLAWASAPGSGCDPSAASNGNGDDEIFPELGLGAPGAPRRRR